MSMPMEISSQNLISIYLNKNTKAASLAVFRILFGSLMLFSIIRFWYYGWIEKLYLLPDFHFKYSGFEWVTVPGQYLYLIFIVCGLSALCVALGYFYRLSIIAFFFTFTYIELLDKTTYLNHYYFVSVISFMLIWLPAHAYFSIDSQKDDTISATSIPRWTIDCLKIMLGIIYVYAGLAKLNSDWMLEAKPLSIWLSSKTDFYILGKFFEQEWVHYLFSWGGAIYDLLIVFFLLWSRTRIFAFITVVLFHVMTWLLFPIGMFPWIMICSTIIFFSPELHNKILKLLSNALNIVPSDKTYRTEKNYPVSKVSLVILTLFLLLQLIIPFRHIAMTDNIYWTEEGYRFSWRVMLMEKTGYANFKVLDTVSQKRFYVQNDDFLTSMQEKQMSTQPDFILEYGQYLGHHFTSQGHQNIAVYIESNVSLNGRPSQVFINPDVNLMQVDYRNLCQNHITPMIDVR